MAQQDFYQQIYILREFQDHAVQDDFTAIFGEEVGLHLWHKFTFNHDGDILMLFTAGLDLANQRKFIKYLEEKT